MKIRTLTSIASFYAEVQHLSHTLWSERSLVIVVYCRHLSGPLGTLFEGRSRATNLLNGRSLYRILIGAATSASRTTTTATAVHNSSTTELR